MAKLYRPVGLIEMELILNTESKKFPKRLPSQPIFYPVLNFNYARQIALKWNTTDINSGFVGYVTEFEVDDSYISQYKVQNVGNSTHNELWIPAEDLKEFNENIIGNIIITAAFYGKNYVGLTPKSTILENKGLKEQLIELNKTLKNSYMDFKCQIELSWKSILLNLIYWDSLDLTKDGMDQISKVQLLNEIYEILKENRRGFIKDII